MRNRDFILLLIALLLAPLAALHAAEPKLNVLLILSDDHSYPHVGCYGNKDILTPNLDKFASQGMRFDRAYVTCPQCVPSRASIFTGRSCGGDCDVAFLRTAAARCEDVSRGVARGGVVHGCRGAHVSHGWRGDFGGVARGD